MARRSAQHSMAQRSAQYLMATTACGARLQAGSLSLGSTLDSTLSGLGSLALVCLKLDSGVTSNSHCCPLIRDGAPMGNSL